MSKTPSLLAVKKGNKKTSLHLFNMSRVGGGKIDQTKVKRPPLCAVVVGVFGTREPVAVACIYLLLGVVVLEELVTGGCWKVVESRPSYLENLTWWLWIWLLSLQVMLLQTSLALPRLMWWAVAAVDSDVASNHARDVAVARSSVVVWCRGFAML